MLQSRGTQEALAIEPWVIGGKYRAQLKRRTLDSTLRLWHAFRVTHRSLEGRGNQDVVFSGHGSSTLWPLSQPKGLQATLCRPAHGYLDQGGRGAPVVDLLRKYFLKNLDSAVGAFLALSCAPILDPNGYRSVKELR